MENWKEIYGKDFSSFLDRILDWNPDYIVPIERKCVKLFRTIKELPDDLISRIFYREYFDFMNVLLHEKKIAIVDDAVKTGSTLRSYRDFFTQRNAKEIKTFAFLGHENLLNATDGIYDPEMEEPQVIVSEPAYQEYFWRQSYYLLGMGLEQDINHLVLEINLGSKKENEQLLRKIEDIFITGGYVYDVHENKVPGRIVSVDSPRALDEYFTLLPKMSKIYGIKKLRFHLTETGRLILVPMIFPRLKLKRMNMLTSAQTPFQLPCQFIKLRNEKFLNELYYWSTSLLLSVELCRAFLLFLSSNLGYEIDFHINPIDFTRYFGKQRASTMTKEIYKLLKEEKYQPLNTLKKTLQSLLDLGPIDITAGSMLESDVAEMINFLRKGYEEQISKNNSRFDANNHDVIHFCTSLHELKEVTNSSYMLITKMIDAECDKGILVPCIEPRSVWVERVWRTGEPDYYGWKRTERLVPLVINRASLTERAQGRGGVLITDLTKIIANFCFDYPSDLQFNPINKEDKKERLHNFRREPYMHGTEVRAWNDIFAPTGVYLYDYQKLGNLYEIDKPSRGRRRICRMKEGALDDIDQFLNNDICDKYDEMLRYFELLSQLVDELKSARVLTAFSICRTKEEFLKHIFFNLEEWARKFREFLDSEGVVARNKLGISQEAVNAGLEKMKMLEQFPAYLSRLRKKGSQEIGFKNAANRILRNTEILSESQIPYRKEISDILKLQKALCGLALAKMFPSQFKKKSPVSVFKSASDVIELHKTSYSRDLFWRSNNIEARKILFNFYFIISEMIEKIKEQSKISTNDKEYPKFNESVAVTHVVGEKWNELFCLCVFLSNMRGNNREIGEGYINLYDLCQQYAREYDAHYIPLRRGRKSKLMFISKNPNNILRIAVECCMESSKSGLSVNFGCSAKLIGEWEEYESIRDGFEESINLCKIAEECLRSNSILITNNVRQKLERAGGEYVGMILSFNERGFHEWELCWQDISRKSQNASEVGVSS